MDGGREGGINGWMAFDLLYFPKGRDTAVSLVVYHPDPPSRTACPALEVLLKIAFSCQLPPTPVRFLRSLTLPALCVSYLRNSQQLLQRRGGGFTEALGLGQELDCLACLFTYKRCVMDCFVLFCFSPSLFFSLFKKKKKIPFGISISPFILSCDGRLMVSSHDNSFLLSPWPDLTPK